MPNDDDLDHIAAISDPAARARAATERLAIYQAAVTRLARIRREAIAQLRASGLSYGRVADALGVSRGRIAQLRGTGHAVERDFFGDDIITITTPLRAGEGTRPVVAQEDFEAASQLARYLNSVEIDTSFGQVAPAGEIDFTPPGLILICGPKSSPVARKLFDTDPRLQFNVDEAGRWRLTERASGEQHASPRDDDPSADRDVAYLGRLDRPDGGPPVLVIAGVHAIGSLGVVHFLSQPGNVHQLHREIGTHRFSMVIGSAYTTSPLQILSSQADTPPLVHEG